MNILLYHFGYRGDILLSGQNFTRELKLRYPDADIDLMLRPRMRIASDFVEPFGFYRQILFGEKKDYHLEKDTYDLSFIIDERIWPEGLFRTVFTRAGFPFRQHKLNFVTTEEDNRLAAEIVAHYKRPIIATQDDMARKWPKEKSEDLLNRLSKIGSVLMNGPDIILPGCDRSLTFRESAALLRKADIFVGIDSGIAHTAALVGTQTVVIPMAWPELWNSPRDYANPFIADENLKHIVIRPPTDEFCGHYLCLRPAGEGRVKRFAGEPMRVKCVWKKRWGVFTKPCCFSKISVDTFYNTVVEAMQRRNLI
jgi:ADP-heptose:LPS heptosyltransferase